MTKHILLTMISEDRDGTESRLPTIVEAENIRNAHPRKYGKTGTRVIFKNGSALVVADLFPAVVEALTGGALASDWVAPTEPVLDEEDEENVTRMVPRQQN